MNLYEFEGRELLKKHGIAIPQAVIVRRGDDVAQAYQELGVANVVAKAQVLSGKRGKNNGIRFCSSRAEVQQACDELFGMQIRGQYVATILLTEHIAIAEEHYLSITYDTNKKQPVLLYSAAGGMDIEDVAEDSIQKYFLDVRQQQVDYQASADNIPRGLATEWQDPGRQARYPALVAQGGVHCPVPYSQEVWNCFCAEDARVVEINPFVKTTDGRWMALDAKIALDEDAFYRHEEWKNFALRTMLGRLPTEREMAVRRIDEGENYYRGTAGKYIEMDGDIAILFSGGGASIANMDALIKAGLKPANYTEYSGNPPREKVYQLAKIVLSKPGLRGLWIAGGVANFTNIAETFHGIVDALDEIKPTYPIVVRRAGPYEEEGMQLMRECAERNHLQMTLFGKETPMSETASILAQMVTVHMATTV